MTGLSAGVWVWVSIRGLSVGSLIRDLCGGLTVGGVPFPPYCTTGRRRAQGTCSFLSPAAPWASCLWPFSGGACGDRVHLSVPPRGPGSSQTQGLCSRSPCPELPRTRALSVLVSSPPPRPPRSWPHCHCWPPTASPERSCAQAGLCPLPLHRGCRPTCGVLICVGAGPPLLRSSGSLLGWDSAPHQGVPPP